MPRRMLIVHMGGIGDFLLCCPAIECLAQEYAVELLGRPGRLALAIAGGIAKQAHNIESSGFESLFTTPDETIRALLAGFDAAIVWMRDEDGALKRSIELCGVADVRVFPGLPPKSWSRHASEYYLARLGLRCSEPFRLGVRHKEAGFDVAIHPGSGSVQKRWPLEHFVALAETLEERGKTVCWYKGPAEAELVLPEKANVFSPGSLFELAQWLAGARVYVGNDSGITHLAAACGIETAAVFGPTDPRVWAPKGPNVHVVSGDPWPPIETTLETVLESFEHA